MRVHLRIWDGHVWIADRNAYGGAAPEGVAEFELPTARRAAPGAGEPAPETAVAVSVQTGDGTYGGGSLTVGGDFADLKGVRKRVFISYSRLEPDERVAKQLYETLRGSHEVFYDCLIEPGEVWSQRIEQELNAADYFVVLLSEKSIAQEGLQGEIEIACEMNNCHPGACAIRQTVALRPVHAPPPYPALQLVR